MRILFLWLILSGILVACGSVDEDRILPTRIVLDDPTAESEVNISEHVRVLEFWQAVDDVFTDEEDVHRWTFTGQVGDNINIRSISQGFETELVLIAPDTSELRRGRNLLYQLPQTGIYTVEVHPLDGFGAYELGLSYSDRQNPASTSGEPLPEVVGVPTPLPANTNLGTFITELVDSQTVAGTLSDQSDSHVYTIDGLVGQYLNLDMTRVSGNLRPLIRLLTSDGRSLAVDNGSAGQEKAAIRNVILPADDLYIVQVQTNADAGSYALFADLSDDFIALTPSIRFTPIATPLPPETEQTPIPYEVGTLMRRGEIYRGAIPEPDNFMTYSFAAEEGEIMTVGAIPVEDSALIPKMELIDPSGIPIQVVSGLQTPDDRSAMIRGRVIEVSGPHTVIVTSEGESTGDFMIAVNTGTTNVDLIQGEALLDRTNESLLTQTYVKHSWYAYLSEGSIVSASIEPLDDVVDVILELRSASGDLVGISRDESGQRQPEIVGVEIPDTDYYYFQVRAVEQATMGRYGLVWRYVSIAPTPEPPLGAVALMKISGQVDDRNYAFYPLFGRAGQTIRIKVESLSDSFDPVVTLLSAEAEVLIEVDDTGTDLNPSFTYTLPADGIYNIRVNGYQQGGMFELLVEELF